MPFPQRPRYLLVVTQDGHAKRTPIDEIKPRRRGTKGVMVVQQGHRLGGVALVGDDGDVLVVTQKGRVVRVAVKEIEKKTEKKRRKRKRNKEV
jgi:DNA gyrase subunit A